MGMEQGGDKPRPYKNHCGIGYIHQDHHSQVDRETGGQRNREIRGLEFDGMKESSGSMWLPVICEGRCNHRPGRGDPAPTESIGFVRLYLVGKDFWLSR